ncbi:MAG: type II toxin-antitoxin system Phd/YefM family antitoxin [Chloroflexi bacterium]|nr:type II toxin-antitoxin system Phd/YefM family antitoxin [Chloroflexota bacterium]
MDRQMSISEARKLLAQLVDNVEFRGEQIVIIRHSQPAAALVPMEVYRRWQAEREELFAAVHALQSAATAVDAEQAARDALDAQQAVRQENAGKS